MKSSTVGRRTISHWFNKRFFNMRTIDLFAGIGGFSLAAEWMGWETVAWVEQNQYCQEHILKHFFPTAKGCSKIEDFDGTEYRNTIDIITGGFPCQPFSNNGLKKGKADHRFLWDEMLRVIRNVQPHTIIAENVYGLVTMENGKTLHRILLDLEGEGYRTQPIIIPACAVQADHRRDRIFIIAHSERKRLERKQPCSEIQHEQKANAAFRPIKSIYENDLPTSRFLRANNGFSHRMDRTKALGNAVVPQVIYQLYQIINQSIFQTS